MAIQSTTAPINARGFSGYGCTVMKAEEAADNVDARGFSGYGCSVM